MIILRRSLTESSAIMAITTAGPKGLFPDRTFIARELIPSALIFLLTTNAGGIEGDSPLVRIPYIQALPEVGFVKEGADIDESNPTLSEIWVSTAKVALLSKITLEASSFSPAGTMVSDSMLRAVISASNVALLSNPAPGVGTEQEPTGLLNIPGIVDAGALAADNVDAIAEAITSIEVNGGVVSHIVCDPASFGILRLMKSATGSNLPLLGAPSEQTGRQLFGVPLIVDQAMAAGTVLIVDSSNIISAAGTVQVSTSDDYYFNSQSRALRVSFRFGFKALKPNRIAKLSVDVTP